jgi:tetratricopeptide (TPR) repeat protein
MTAKDGKKRKITAANTEAIFRIIQSIPSKKAEPFKQWLAKVGYERIQEIENPELAAERARQYYRELGYSYKNLDRIEEAEETYRKGIKISDNDFEKSAYFTLLYDTLPSSLFLKLTIEESKENNNRSVKPSTSTPAPVLKYLRKSKNRLKSVNGISILQPTPMYPLASVSFCGNLV